ASSRMFSVKPAPTCSQAWMSRPRCRHTVTMGGSNEHCCTQLTSMPVSAVPCRAVRMNSPLGIRPTAASNCFCSSPMFAPRPQRLLDERLHVLHLAVEPAAVALAVIDLDRAGDAVAVRLQRLVAAPDDGENLVPLALQRRAHRVQAVVQTAR